jgi:L,D-transpeptidase ErfK/SrfK
MKDLRKSFKCVSFRLLFLLVLATLLLLSCGDKIDPPIDISVPEKKEIKEELISTYFEISYDVPLRSYFQFMDTLVAHLDTTLNYPVNEHLVVHANTWLIDTLAHTDYYHLMERGLFIEDPQSLLALRRGQKLLIPDEEMVNRLLQKLEATVIDINIPEFKLRIIEGDAIVGDFPVRVGRVQKKYLAMAGKKVDLRTKTGTGNIVRINRFPTFINPSNNKRYDSTLRDDGKRTKLPGMPWIEPELDGIRYGQLIHPTTNPKTLGKSYSNGCIGVKEGDMWRIYYHAPLGTKVVVRYDLEVIGEKGDTTLLKNIYPGFEQKEKRRKNIAALMTPGFDVHNTTSFCDCGVIQK